MVMVKCITYHVPSYFPRNIKDGGWSVILQMQGVYQSAGEQYYILLD